MELNNSFSPTKKGILYRRYGGKQNTDHLVQLVVPNKLREKVVSLARDTLLAGHRGAGKTLSRVQQEFYWPGIHEYVTSYVASCDLCQRNVSKGTVAKAPMEKLHIGDSVLLFVAFRAQQVNFSLARSIQSRQSCWRSRLLDRNGQWLLVK